MFINIDEDFILGGRSLLPNIRLIERYEIESAPWQSVAAISQALRI